MSTKEEDPRIYRNGSSDNDDNPRFVRFSTGFDLNDPGWKPFDWTTTLLMLDTAKAHARESARLSESRLESLHRELERLSAHPERSSNPAASRQIAEEQAAQAIHLASVWKGCESQVESLHAKIAVAATSDPFSEVLVEDLIAGLAAMRLHDCNGEPAT